MYGNYYGFNPGYYPSRGAMPDNLAQLRGQQVQMPQGAAQYGNGIIWVLGEAEARSYPVAPGNTVILWDRDNPTIFVKSADASGIPSIKAFDLVERKTFAESPQNPLASPEASPMSEYITRGEFDKRMAKIEAVMSKEGVADG